MSVPLWIIAVCVLVLTIGKGTAILFVWYVERTKYAKRSAFKKALNWIVNGSYE